MPLIEIKVLENEFSEQERAGVIDAVTDAIVRFTGETIRPHTWVVLQEVKNGSWGIAGMPLGLPEARALQAAADPPLDPAPPAGRPRRRIESRR